MLWPWITGAVTDSLMLADCLPVCMPVCGCLSASVKLQAQSSICAIANFSLFVPYLLSVAYSAEGN